MKGDHESTKNITPEEAFAKMRSYVSATRGRPSAALLWFCAAAAALFWAGEQETGQLRRTLAFHSIP